MKRSTWIVLGVATVAGILLYRKWRDMQRAQAHPIAIAPDSSVLKTIQVNPNLVSDAQIVF